MYKVFHIVFTIRHFLELKLLEILLGELGMQVTTGRKS